MIIDMLVHPFCKEAKWGDNIKKFMYRFFRFFNLKISIDDYISTMEKFGIDKAIIVSFNLKSVYSGL